MSARIDGNDLRMAMVEKIAKHNGPYDTSLLREVFDFCWEQLTWRATDKQLCELLNELAADVADDGPGNHPSEDSTR